MRLIKRYVGDRAFYKSILVIAIPIMIQNGITNFVTLLDNLMVGRLGTEAMSGVSIVNQFIFIFNLCVFGALAAAGIFTSQYFGVVDHENVRYTFRFKIISNLVIGVIGVAVFLLFDEWLINLFLHGDDTVGNIAKTLEFGKQYTAVMTIGLIPYAIAQAYASTVREVGNTVMPMVASVAAVITNLLLNIVLIFGYLGFPALGVVGAAIATVISRFVELAILVIYTHAKHREFIFIEGAYRSLYIPWRLFRSILAKGVPLMFNEVLWAIAITMRNQCYSTRGIDVVAAQNINLTIFNVMSVIYMAIGVSISIVVGRLLGAGKIEEAQDTDRKMIAFSIFCGTVMAFVLIAVSGLFPKLYNTSDEIRSLAAYMMIVSAVTMPFCSFAHSSYFTIRSGGKILVTMLLDSIYMWAVVMPISAAIAYLTGFNIYVFFAIGQGLEVIKAFFGGVLLKYGNWAHSLVEPKTDPEAIQNGENI